MAERSLNEDPFEGTEPRNRALEDALCQVIQFPIPLDGKQREEASRVPGITSIVRLLVVKSIA